MQGPRRWAEQKVVAMGAVVNCVGGSSRVEFTVKHMIFDYLRPIFGVETFF
jgi:hypothetical protein